MECFEKNETFALCEIIQDARLLSGIGAGLL